MESSVRSIQFWSDALELAGALVAVFGLLSALLRVDGRVARLANWIARLFRRGENARVRFSGISVNGVAVEVAGEGEMELLEPDPNASLLERIQALETQLRDELKNRQSTDRSLGQRLNDTSEQLLQLRSHLTSSIGSTRADLLYRLDQQARTGLGIATTGAVLAALGAGLGLLDYLVG